MNTLQRHLLTAAVLAGLGLGAIAQTQTPPAPPAGGSAPQTMQGSRQDPERMERYRARAEQRMAKRLGALKQKLQITPAQEGAWSAWTGALKPTSFQRPSRGEFARLTTPERIDRMKARRAQRAAEMDQRLDATKSFYAALSAEQKKTFDAEGMRFMRGGKRGFGGHHHGRGGHRS
jgi:hypothetical protein